MTNSMIPNSFVPGTKAKANEINENFTALADAIDQNKNLALADINGLTNSLSQLTQSTQKINEEKADKTELSKTVTVEEADTDLNNYKEKGTYIFPAACEPENIPKGQAGTLLVTGLEESVVQQIWICNDENPEIFTRTFSDYVWSDWKSVLGKTSISNSGYMILPNGLILQWGEGAGPIVTYPLAYSTFSCPVFMKYGFNGVASRSDVGFRSYDLTGFIIDAAGAFASANWISIGI